MRVMRLILLTVGWMLVAGIAWFTFKAHFLTVHDKGKTYDGFGREIYGVPPWLRLWTGEAYVHGWKWMIIDGVCGIAIGLLATGCFMMAKRLKT